MKYFKNSELTDIYGISDKAVRNWIEGALQGKNNLELCLHNNKYHIVDTLTNYPVIVELLEKGKKYRNHRSHKSVEPRPDFYQLFNLHQVADIINSLEVKHEHPHQYSYRGAGANYWSAYLDKLDGLRNGNYLAYVKELLEECEPFVEKSLRKYSGVNIIDIGVGNGLAIKDFIQKLSKAGTLKRYIGIDISPELLNITESNLQSALAGIKMEKYVYDISNQSFGEVTIKSATAAPENKVLNIFLFLGGTIVNFPHPAQVIRTIRESLGKDDILITSLKVDNIKSRRFFDFNPESSKSLLPPHFKFVLDILNIEESLYDVEQFYDNEQRARFVRVKLKFDLTINFTQFNRQVELKKNEYILLWRAWHFGDNDVVNLWTNGGLSLLYATKTDNEEYTLLALKPRI